MTGFNTQVGNGEYRLQFETADLKKYEIMQYMARLMIDLENAENKYDVGGENDDRP